MKDKLEYRLYLQREREFFHEPFKNEQFIYKAVLSGDVDAIEENRRKYAGVRPQGKGELSDDELKNELYHMIINTAVISKLCATAGLPQEVAYTLSDMYIRSGDKARTVEEIKRLNDEMTLEFATLMKQHNGSVYSKAVRDTANYICNNLHKKLSQLDIAEKIGYDRSYLAMLFKRETGETIGGYIRRKRLETAANLLRETAYSCSEIASSLGFSSQSHFTKLFHEAYGVTPEKYRREV